MKSFRENPDGEENQIATKQHEREVFALRHSSSVPDGFDLLPSSEFFRVGDIVADCSGKWRGPITFDSDMVGREIRSYLCSSTEGILPAVRAAARRKVG